MMTSYPTVLPHVTPLTTENVLGLTCGVGASP